MIRFVDLTQAYWTDPEFGRPICAFINTVDDRFIENDDGAHTFCGADEVPDDRCRALVPDDFWNRVPL